MPFDTAALADVVLLDPDASEHRLGNAWSDGPAVLLFLRHFG